MERSAFTLLHDMESTWWYRGRRRVVEGALSRAGLPEDASRPVLDFGAGYGGMKEALAPYGRVEAFEPDAEARAALAIRGYAALYETADEAFKKPYELIGLFDVLEHIETDDSFLKEMRVAVAPGGRLIFTVPAMPFLWSTHDVSHHHYRRYTKASLRKRLIEAGYEVRYISYWNMLLFIPAALARLIGKTGESSFNLPHVLDQLFYMMVSFESFLMKFFPLPFGVSLVAVARKTDQGA